MMWRIRSLEWRDGAGGRLWAALALLALTVTVGLVYAIEPQSPADFRDRLTLAFDDDAYGPNLRSGERMLAGAARADALGMDSVAESLLWTAAGNFEKAAANAGGPRDELAANDRLADAYLDLGMRHLARGRGGRFGIGGEAEELRAAEDIGSCVVGVAPTRRRAAVNAFLVELEEELERPLEGRCPR